MWVAAFELHSTYTDVFTMLGFPLGAATDAAALVSWSDSHALEGVKMLADALERLQRTPFSTLQIVSESRTRMHLDARGGSVLEVGVSALDCAQAHERVVSVCNIHDGAFCAGLGQVAIERGCAINLTWRQHDQPHQMQVNAHARTLEIIGGGSDARLGSNDIVLTPGQVVPEVTQPGAFHLSASMLAERAYASLIDGVEVDDVAWGKVMRIARRILVSESTLSRTAGAGVGADED